MDDQQKRGTLKQQLDGLSGTQLDRVSEFIRDLIAAEAQAIARKADIQALPRIITDYPILVWGWDPCHYNDICEVWFGPLTAPVVNVRKRYPQHEGLDRYQTLAMLVSNSSGDAYIFASENPTAWLEGVPVSGKELVELAQWALKDTDWPSVHNPADKTLQPADLARVSSEAEHIIESLGEGLCETAATSLRRVVEHIQTELHNRGMNLSSSHAEVGFSFDREKGTIAHLDGRKFIELIHRSSPPAPAGILIADGVSLEGKDLAGARLAQRQLEWMEMSGVNLAGADLRGAALSHADLSGADLSGAKLTHANLERASLANAKLGGADLTDAALDRADLTGVIFDETTRWPEGFRPPGKGE